MNRFVSQKIRFFSFVCIALLLFVHGYNLEETYLQPFSLVKEPLTFTTYFEYFVANAADGNGLGNMQKRAESMKGTVKIQSSEKEGTTVIVMLPIS